MVGCSARGAQGPLFNQAHASCLKLDIINRTGGLFVSVTSNITIVEVLCFKCIRCRPNCLIHKHTQKHTAAVSSHWERLNCWNQEVAGATGNHSIIASWIENEVGVITHPYCIWKAEKESSMQAGGKKRKRRIFIPFSKDVWEEKDRRQGTAGRLSAWLHSLFLGGLLVTL